VQLEHAAEDVRLMVEGAVGMPASVAISAMFNWSSVLPKYTSAAAATP
jgi:hypothetical protein